MNTEKTLQDLIDYAYYSRMELSISEINQLLQEHPHLNIDYDTFASELKKFANNTDSRAKYEIQNLINHPEIRRLSKRLHTACKKPQLSLTNFKESIASFVIVGSGEASYSHRQHLITKQMIDLSLSCILSAEHLKHETEMLFAEWLTPMNYQKQTLISDKMILSVELFGKYVDALSLNASENELSDIREKLRQLISSDDSMIQKKIQEHKDRIKENETRVEQENQKEVQAKLEERKQQLLEQLKDTLEASDFEKSPNASTLSSSEITALCTINNLPEIAYKVFKDYFMCADYTFDEYARSVHNVIDSLEAYDNPSMLEYLCCCVLSASNEFFRKNQLPLDSDFNDKINFVFALHFLILLSYCLMQYEQSSKFIDSCYTMVMKEEELKDNFDMISSALDYTLMFNIAPIELYHAKIIGAVLLAADKKPVARKIKHYLRSLYPNMEKDLQSVNFFQMYEQCEGYYPSDFTNDFSLYAVTFMYNYFKDRKYLASNSAFVHYANTKISQSFHQIPGVIYLALKKEALEESDTNVKEFENRFSKHRKELNEIKKRIMNDDLSEILHDTHQTYLHACYSYSGKSESLMPYSELEVLIEENMNHLILFLDSYEEYHDVSFQSLTFHEKVNQIYQLCLSLQNFKNIELTESYLPKTLSENNESRISELSQSIEVLQTSLHHKDKTIENMQLKADKYRQDIENVLRKKIRSIESSYNKEIHQLTKQIKDLKHVIDESAQMKDELFKLREMMFKLNHEETDEPVVNIDLKDLIQNKNILLVGGHIKLIDKLKKKYPQMKAVQSETADISDITANADHVFIFHTFINHSLYYKTISFVTKHQIPWDYIPFTNLEKTENEMLRILNNESLL